MRYWIVRYSEDMTFKVYDRADLMYHLNKGATLVMEGDE